MGCSKKRKSQLGFGFFMSVLLFSGVESKCSKGCDLALASYYIQPDSNLSFISSVFSTPIGRILSFNPQIPNRDYIVTGSRANIPFSCECIDGDYLGHKFLLTAEPTATYREVAAIYLSNLTTVESLQRSGDAQFNVTLNCSCGDGSVSKDYGLFVTYPLRPGESLASVANASGLPLELLQRYNPNVNLTPVNNLVFIPGRDQSGNYLPFKSSKTGMSKGVLAGICMAIITGVLLWALSLYLWSYRRKTRIKASYDKPAFEDHYMQNRHENTLGPQNSSKKTSETASSPSSALAAVAFNKAVEFSYEELAKATNGFSIGHKIGQGGFAAVYYAELRGERAAVKTMDTQASKEFLAELKVLTHVHHLNLVRLLGYCTEVSLCLVYEFIDNGNLSQHLHGRGRDPLPWTTRVRIALDSARGLEYIHEHTFPVYIHRDIKSANILIDKNFRAKVADFGLAKLTAVGGVSVNSRLMGTFGYMAPEYARYGDVSPKVDVYAFGVVLYELISAQAAIVKANELVTNSTGLIALFADAFSKPNPAAEIRKLVDPRIGDDYPIDSVHKMAQLARACTQEIAQFRPTMRSVVVALMTLLSSTENWDAGSLYETQALPNLMSAR